MMATSFLPAMKASFSMMLMSRWGPCGAGGGSTAGGWGGRQILGFCSGSFCNAKVDRYGAPPRRTAQQLQARS